MIRFHFQNGFANKITQLEAFSRHIFNFNWQKYLNSVKLHIEKNPAKLIATGKVITDENFVKRISH